MTAPALTIGLHEWQVCCDALIAGTLSMVVRKGGIHERKGGLFAPEHDRFALIPTWLHQDAGRLRNPRGMPVRPAPPAGQIPIPGWCEIAQVWRVTDLTRLLALGSELAWTEAELRARFAYRDQPFVFVLALRVWRFPEPVIIPDAPAYAGCRSWIPLLDLVSAQPAVAAMDEATFYSRLSTLNGSLSA